MTTKVFGLTPEHERYGKAFAERVISFFEQHQGFEFKYLLCGYDAILDYENEKAYRMDSPSTMVLVLEDRYSCIREYRWNIGKPYDYPINHWDIESLVKDC